MLDMLGWLAAVQGAAALGWLLAARVFGVRLDWRVLAGLALPGLLTATLAWLRYAPKEMEGGRGLVFAMVSLGAGVLAALLALPGVWLVEQRWGATAA